MAGELTYSITYTWTTGTNNARIRRGATISTDQASKARYANVLAIGTSEESVDFSSVAADISSRGLLYLRNQDATNYVEVGCATGDYFGKLLPGEENWISWNPSETTIYLKANTATCNVELELYSR